jgi:DNA-binding phage protein
MYMTKKIDVASLPDFNPAQFIRNEDISLYLRIVKEEGDPVALGEALNTVFMALGASAVADALNMNVSQVWDVLERPLEHPNTLQQICDVIESGSLAENTTNPHLGTDFEDFLRAEGIHDEVTAQAVRRVIAALLKQRS